MLFRTTVLILVSACWMSACGGSSGSGDSNQKVPDCFTELTADGGYSADGSNGVWFHS